MVDLQTITISITGVIAIITLYESYKQNRNNAILKYYDKTQDIRGETDKLESDDVEKAKSLLRKSLNLYNVLSYSILKNIVDEKDAFKILRKNILNIRKKCIDIKMDLNDYKYLNKLYNRWDDGGLVKYYRSLIVKWIILLLIISFIIYINI